ncbi:MAG: histidine kinase [Candidatus Amulumruptor caecigallinarius]|nr:histidine kinase [Candidatus Amulumruptor caecigallinarius]MCM1396276.1 histidine kinase [Candidatus Amulumruptor caecigallinarius]MCM1454270.1 histidine kinase [bacterium]
MTLNKKLRYLILTLTFLLMSPGNWTVTALLDARCDYWSGLWMYFPSPIIFLLALVINDRWIVNPLLRKGNFSQYVIASFLLSFAAATLASAIEGMLALWLNLPYRAPFGVIPSILSEGLANSLWLSLILLGDALIQLYDKLRSDVREQKAMAESLTRYINRVKSLLDPAYISRRLQEIQSLIHQDAVSASDLISNFSDWLRQQLSLMPDTPMAVTRPSGSKLFTPLLDLMVEPRYRGFRHAGVVVTLIMVTVFTAAFDLNNDTGRKIGVGILVFTELLVIPYVIYFWFYRRFRATLNLRHYTRSVCIFLAVLISPMLASIPMYYIKAPTDTPIASLIVQTLVFAAGIVSLLLYEYGISAFLFFVNWIKVNRRSSALQTEVLRQEYLFLRRQVNPHFLFNVLNNVEISACDSLAYACQLLADIDNLLQYQFAESVAEAVTVREEVDFLNSYLELEGSRRERFGYVIEMDVASATVRIPTMLYITFIENAAKYSSPDHEGMNVRATFSIDDSGMLLFECHNHYDPRRVALARHNAIGIENVRRRLNILYEGRASLVIISDHHIYSVKLTIPLHSIRDYEMYHC